MFWYVFILHLCNHSCTTNKESLNNQCGLIDSAALCNITLPLNIISPQCNYIHSRLTLSLNAAVFLAVKIKLFTAGLLKSIFSFMGYISDCSALTHMFLQATCCTERPLLLLLLSPLSPVSLAGWPNHPWQAGAFHAALRVFVWHTVQKSRDTQDPLQHVRLPPVCSDCRGASRGRRSVCRRWRHVWIPTGCSSTPRGPPNFKLWGWYVLPEGWWRCGDTNNKWLITHYNEAVKVIK